MVRLLAERSDTRSNVKLGGFQSQLQASSVSSHTEVLWYNETFRLWMSIYIYVCACMCTAFVARKKQRKKERKKELGLVIMFN